MDNDKNVYKLELLDLFKRVDSVLTRNNIRYFCMYGTCIGAIRHNGIIPWDNDIDIAVFRSDFDKAISCLNKQGDALICGDSKILSCCPKYFGRVFNRIDSKASLERRRAYIDIYVIDYADNWKLLFLIRSFICVGLRRILARRKGNIGHQHPFLYSLVDVILLPLRIFPSKIILKLHDLLYFSSVGKKYVRIAGGATTRRHFMSEFVTSYRVAFNDTTIPVPCGYETLLTRSYGDWRTPPPVNERCGNAFVDYDGSWSVSLPKDQERTLKHAHD